MPDSLYHAPHNDLLFCLNEIAGLNELLGFEPYRDFSADLIDSVIGEAGRFASEQIAPLNRSGDRQGCKLGEDGKVQIPNGFAEAYQSFIAQGWNAAPFPVEYGGQGLPQCVSSSLSEIWQGANLSFALMPLLTHSAVHLLLHYGTDWQRQHVLPKLVSGEWCGTMCLTEPQAGSDVGAARCLAVPQADGTYRLKGSKIFISCGDHPAAANIIHMVLARISGAPEGSKGLSVFMVPKFLINTDGSLGTSNDLRPVSLEHKLGMHATPTALMAFGDNEGAVATLVGGAGEGLKTMFTMMNAARLAVGLEGLGIAQYASQLAWSYAEERVQGRAVASSATQPVAIAQHPDVRRMLLDMESHVQALRALAIYTSSLIDRASHHPDAEARQKAKLRLDLLIPVMKAHTTNNAFDITSTAIQVYGGLGYIEETGIAQLLRDIRVSMIYEGTNGIQALDLAQRKLPVDDGLVMHELLAEMENFAAALGNKGEYVLAPLGKLLAKGTTHLRDAMRNMLLQVKRTQNNDQGDAPSAASAVYFLKLFGIVLEAYFLALSANRAFDLTKAGSTEYPAQLLAQKIELAHFFLSDTLLEAGSLKERVLLGNRALNPQGPGPT